MSDKTCDNCGKENNIKPFDMTGRKFCNLECFRSFYETKELNHSEPTEDFTPQKIRTIQEHENAWCAPFMEPDKLFRDNKTGIEMMEERIRDLISLSKEYKLAALEVRKHVLKVNASNEADKVERYRKYGVNSDSERKDQILNTQQKMIQRYKKMGMSAEKIYENFKEIMDISLENLKDEYSKL